MSDDHTITKVFTVQVPVERAWAAFADGSERSKWEADTYEIDPRPGGRVHWTLPGIESTGQVEEVVEHELLRHTEQSGPHGGAEITVRFESVDGGTTITVTHAGFGSGEGWDEWLEGTSLGWSQAIADLVAYLETGAAVRRFAVRMGSPGMQMHDTPAGIRVEGVQPDAMADQAGLQVGDLLLRVGGAPVFSIAELWVLLREHAEGETLTVDYVRGGEVLQGKGAIGTW